VRLLASKVGHDFVPASSILAVSLGNALHSLSA
jgi:hypothetical protein